MKQYRTTTLTAGMDLGDRYSEVCVVDGAGEVIERTRLQTTERGVRHYFEGRVSMRAVIEVGTHSPWVSRLLEELGHEVLVANPRKVRLIYGNERKSDHLDSESLARLGRLDPVLLSPIRHRGSEAQADLALVRTRAVLVEARTKLINHVRGTVKSSGHRLGSCSSASFGRRFEEVPEGLRTGLEPVFRVLAKITETIREYERWIDDRFEQYSEASAMVTAPGVGSLTALAFVTTLESPTRFARSRQVGAYVGLVQRRNQSGASDPQGHITKAGDPYLRKLLVGSAQYILGPFGPDSALKRWGLALAARGGKSAKKRAVVAVARKLAVLLHQLWMTGECYEPFPEPPRRRVGVEAKART